MNRLSPLFDRLREHRARGHSSFHTPGHKGNFFSDFLPNVLMNMDYTELPDTDALYEANDVILRTEQNAADLFGVKRSLISAGGCSLAIQAMLRLVSERGKKIICARNAHRSAVNAIALLGLEPVWICPEGENGYTGRISPLKVEELLQKNSDIAACYITSPSYYGEISDIGAIAEVCHRYGTKLVVDNAHGSHLAFMHENIHPAFLGADMTACSLHKTLPVMTGGALLNIADESFVENAKSAMALFGSTSPSYVIMSSIDFCIRYMFARGKKVYGRCEEKVLELKKIAEKHGIKQPKGLCDPIRLTLNTTGLKDVSQQEYFGEYYIDCEFCDGVNAVLICTPFNTERDFHRLQSAIENMPPSCREESFDYILPETVISVREAMLAKSEIVLTENAEGRISANTACPCPPGVPVIMPGEKINAEVISCLKRQGVDTLKIVK